MASICEDANGWADAFPGGHDAPIALVASVSDATAQQPSGLVGGFSIGGGVLAVDRAIGGDSIATQSASVPVTGANVYIGHMLDGKTAGIFVVAGAVGNFGDVVEAAEFDVFGVAVQRWLAPNVWVRGGAGYGVIESTDPTTVEFNTNGSDIGWLAGAGIDVWRRATLPPTSNFTSSGLGATVSAFMRQPSNSESTGTEVDCYRVTKPVDRNQLRETRRVRGDDFFGTGTGNRTPVP